MIVYENNLDKGMLTVFIEEDCNYYFQDIYNKLKLNILGLEEEDFYVLHNGKIISSTDLVTAGVVHVVLRQRGGKGGFGSMLRAIGAQIEKTTNREACRDLSGRRLRDINEEKRLKNWIAQQADRERETAERRKKKLERLCAEPRHEFQDQTYEQERSELTESVSAAVEQGFKATLSNVASKRKCDSQSTAAKKKKTCLWLDADADISSAESDDLLESDEEKEPHSLKPSSNSLYEVDDTKTDANKSEFEPHNCTLVTESSSTDLKAGPSNGGENFTPARSESSPSSQSEDKVHGKDVCSVNDNAVQIT